MSAGRWERIVQYASKPPADAPKQTTDRGSAVSPGGRRFLVSIFIVFTRELPSLSEAAIDCRHEPVEVDDRRRIMVWPGQIPRSHGARVKHPRALPLSWYPRFPRAFPTPRCGTGVKEKRLERQTGRKPHRPVTARAPEAVPDRSSPQARTWSIGAFHQRHSSPQWP